MKQSSKSIQQKARKQKRRLFVHELAYLLQKPKYFYKTSKFKFENMFALFFYHIFNVQKWWKLPV